MTERDEGIVRGYVFVKYVPDNDPNADGRWERVWLYPPDRIGPLFDHIERYAQPGYHAVQVTTQPPSSYQADGKGPC